MTPGTRVNGEQSNESIREGAPNRWQQIRDLDVDLLLLRGTPRPGDNGGPCLQKGGTAEECGVVAGDIATPGRSEEHTSELQSRGHLVCRLLLENKKSTHTDGRL